MSASEARDGLGSAVLRFAPSPTGRLHLGHALSVLLNQQFARRLEGKLLIRIEDTDTTRCRPEFEAAIIEDLAWLGVHSDGPILRQSEHVPVYAAAAAKLDAMGLLYPCFATRQDIKLAAVPGALDPDGAPIYPGLHRALPPDEVARRKTRGEPYAMRLDMLAAIKRARGILKGQVLDYVAFDQDLQRKRVPARPELWGDVVIQRKETTASYHLAVVVDDARQGITHVVRGQDLKEATSIHRLLQVLLGLRAPLYHHHRLLLDGAGRKLAKRDRDTSLASFRERGATPDDVRRVLQLGPALED
ncbi:MAG: tRNA glutamyl-Q(34) synthetase GluQRS [Proteobacteria bacterium]|nr:tRNA glutamyl-Q(34) synthetase GluQRS [Pseudomonadota bacterium]